MEFLQIENDFLAIVLIILAALIPVVIIFYTLRTMRKKRERPSERRKDSFGEKFKSVKEERLEERDKRNNKA